MKEDQKNKIPEDILKQLLSVDPETVYASGYASWQEGDYSRAVIDFSWLVMASHGVGVPILHWLAPG